MRKRRSGQGVPLISGVADLSQTGSSARNVLISSDEIVQRRRFLKMVLSAPVALAAIPAISSCGETHGDQTPPVIVNRDSVYAIGASSATGVRILITFDFSASMDRTSVEGALSIMPAVAYQSEWQTDEGKDILVLKDPTSTTESPLFAFGTSYTVRMSGTARGSNGMRLDGNGDTVAGDDFAVTFLSPAAPGCSCNSQACSCQDDMGCGCVFDFGCASEF